MKFYGAILISLSLITSSASIAKTTVNDVTRLNPISVDKVLRPTTTDQIREAIKTHPGPISIGGGQFSMGGQTAMENGLQLDMRDFNKVLGLDVKQKRITVQSGIRWRDIQEVIDKHNLSIRVMQTYSNFTVGGALSVNAHGRYIGEGPLIRTVESFKIITADGQERLVSPEQNKEIFYGAVGGYGGLGVITEVTLGLTDNEKIRRDQDLMPLEKYRPYFDKFIRNSKDIVFHNGDLYPPDYKSVRAETWRRTDHPLTTEARLIPKDLKYWLEPNVISSISTLPYGSELRSKVLEPLLRNKTIVVWRNYEASYDLRLLEPSTPRLIWTYALQEYFVPTAHLESFVARMKSVFKKHDPNIVNVSIRHALPDPGSLLAWAPEEVFSLVIYYKQRTTQKAQEKVGVWTRELIDAAINEGGRYYLPYQLHATHDQFLRAYPRAPEFFALKAKLDPTNKFRSQFWNKYGAPPTASAFSSGSNGTSESPKTRSFGKDLGPDHSEEKR